MSNAAKVDISVECPTSLFWWSNKIIFRSVPNKSFRCFNKIVLSV